MPDGEPAV